MNTETKHYALLQSLVKSTESKKIKWLPFREETIDGYYVPLQKGVVRITRSINEKVSTTDNPVFDYWISIAKEGKIIDAFDDISLSNGLNNIGETRFATQVYPLMVGLYSLARRSTTGADDVIDSILEELQ